MLLIKQSNDHISFSRGAVKFHFFYALRYANQKGQYVFYHEDSAIFIVFQIRVINVIWVAMVSFDVSFSSPSGFLKKEVFFQQKDDNGKHNLYLGDECHRQWTQKYTFPSCKNYHSFFGSTISRVWFVFIVQSQKRSKKQRCCLC